MNQGDFPPFPALGAKGPQVCAAIRFYLAIRDDLSEEQAFILSNHVQECAGCAAELRILQKATRLVATLPESSPSTRVDEAILAAIGNGNNRVRAPESIQLHTKRQAHTQTMHKRSSRLWRWSSGLAAALVALIILGVFLFGHISSMNRSVSAFQLPATLSWSGYVLHYVQTRTDAQGKSYQVEVYQNLGTNQMHIESTMPDEFDVVVVTDNESMLGKDMLHHIAQTGNAVQSWAVDGSDFELALLRHDLADPSSGTTYLGKGSFQGQPVYQIRMNDGQVLLLSMRYTPVNVLHAANSSSTGMPLYTTCVLMPEKQVADSTWDMQIPSGFHMGNLPEHA